MLNFLELSIKEMKYAYTNHWFSSFFRFFLLISKFKNFDCPLVILKMIRKIFTYRGEARVCFPGGWGGGVLPHGEVCLPGVAVCLPAGLGLPHGCGVCLLARGICLHTVPREQNDQPSRCIHVIYQFQHHKIITMQTPMNAR